MSFPDRVVETAKERPRRSAFAVFLVVFWIAAPLFSQMYLNRSAIKISFTVTVLYYVGWELYELQTS